MSDEKVFNAPEWLQKAKDEIRQITAPAKFPVSVNEEVETVIGRIEALHIDITAVYRNWLDLGFAFSEEFGERGREYFHRVSRFYPQYSYKEADRQFDACLKSRGGGVTIKSFFHLAHIAGVDITHAAKPQSERSSAPATAKKSAKPGNGSTNAEAQSPAAQSANAPGNGFVSSSGKGDLPIAEVGGEQEVEEDPRLVEPIYNTPRLPATVHDRVPGLLKACCDMFSEDIEKDVLLVSALTVISACLPNIEGLYFDEYYTPHLFTFIAAPAGSGKGRVKWARYMGASIHRSLVEQSQIAKSEYERELEHYLNLPKAQREGVKHPVAPKRKMFYIPANSSASGFIQALADNNFHGMIFETEADTLGTALKQEWGNFCDVLRKAFHHESTTMFRRKESEHTEVMDPHLAILLAGTPKQIHNIMPNVENGLFSRFLYYAFEDNSDFRNPFLSYRDINYVEFFETKGKRIQEFYDALKNLPRPIRFRFTPGQGELFTERFNILYKRNRLLLDNDFNASSRRLGLITFRIAMVLSALRMLEDGHFPEQIECSDTDFDIAIQITFILEQHAIAVFRTLPDNFKKAARLSFFMALPIGFTRKEYLAVALEMDLKDKTAQRYIRDLTEIGWLKHEHNWYSKVEFDPLKLWVK
jgi:hypothetical protein